MSQAVETGRAEQKLPKRDWVLLPLLSFLTILFLAGATEVVARQIMPASTSTLTGCLTSGPLQGMKGKPYSQCWEESFETGRVDYRFDRLGYRDLAAPTARSPGNFRVVLTGSSVAFGQHVRMEKDIASALATDLSALTGKPIQVYNQGMLLGFPRSVLLRFDDLTIADPDLIVWVLTPYDIEHAEQLEVSKPPKESTIEHIKTRIKSTRAATLIEYLLFRSPASPVKTRLLAAGSADFLRATQSPELKHSISIFEQYVGRVEELSKAAGIPVVATFVPGRSQAAMISSGGWPAEYDPYELGRQIRSVVEKHGGSYIDILSEFQHVPNAEQHFLPIANHPDADCDALIAKFLAEGMASGVIPALRAHSASNQSNATLLSK